jgi:hypothetical protein
MVDCLKGIKPDACHTSRSVVQILGMADVVPVARSFARLPRALRTYPPSQASRPHTPDGRSDKASRFAHRSCAAHSNHPESVQLHRRFRPA